MIEINIQKLLRTADGNLTLKVDKKIDHGDFLTLFGKSGSGKTTLLRIIAGLETPDNGRVVVDGEVWFDSDKKINLTPQKRGVGFVFQDYALFPNMSVRQNLTYALKNSKEIKRVDEILDVMEIVQLAALMPHQLSGGQKQRVALARALISSPKLLLLDEPLSALDSVMRLKLQEELIVVHKKFNITSILVSHDIGEVFKLSNRVLIINGGTIINDNTPSNAFSNLNISGKFRVVGEVLSIKKADIIFIIEVLANSEIVKITATKSDVAGLSIGDKLLISSKAFNPIFTKLLY